MEDIRIDTIPTLQLVGNHALDCSSNSRFITWIIYLICDFNLQFYSDLVMVKFYKRFRKLLLNNVLNCVVVACAILFINRLCVFYSVLWLVNDWCRITKLYSPYPNHSNDWTFSSTSNFLYIMDAYNHIRFQS